MTRLPRLLLVPPAPPPFDPSSLPLTAWWRDFGGGSWAGSLSTGPSGARSLSATGAPSAGSLNGHGTAMCTEATSFSAGLPLSDFIESGSFSIWCLAKVVTHDSLGTINFAKDEDEYWMLSRYGVFVSNKARISIWDSGLGDYADAAGDTELDEWALMQARYNGTSLYLRVNDGGWSETPASAVESLDATLLIGTYTGVNPAAYELAEFGISKSVFPDTTFDRLLSYARAQYDLTL